MDTLMRIGELAQATGVETETIRYYEKAGLIPGPARSENGYRAYTRAHRERLEFIRHCRVLDMSLDEIRALLQLRDAPEDNCGQVNELLDAHIGHVAERVRELQALEKQLRKLRAQCKSATSAKDCRILQGLAEPTSAVPASAPLATHARARAG